MLPPMPSTSSFTTESPKPEPVFSGALLPLLWTLWTQRRLLRPLPALLLAIFATVMVVVNSWITAMGMGVEFGWLDHLLLALSEVALTVFFLMAPEPEPVTEP